MTTVKEVLDGIPGGFNGYGGDEERPIAFKILFPDNDDEKSDLTKITETPPRMILPLVRMKLLVEAIREDNDEISLVNVFVNEFDDRMISKDRKGRLEAVKILQETSRHTAEDEFAI
jgi:hypothetical protein